MPLVAAAVCPHPPVIVPEIAGRAAGELEDLRIACDAAVARLLAVRPATVVVVGAGPTTRDLGSGVHDSFARFGVPLVVRLGQRASDEAQPVPLSVLVGGWLLSRAGVGDANIRTIAHDAPAAECVTVGRELADRDEPVALLVMGDGSACRGEKSPGYADPRAQPYDDAVAAALAAADSDALLDLDPVLSAELKAAGRAPWQVLAGAVRASRGAWRGDLSYCAAPYGVAYFVATWEPVP